MALNGDENPHQNLIQRFIQQYPTLILTGLACVTVLVASGMVTNTLLRLKQYPDEVIGVTGTSVQEIKSDAAQWSGQFFRQATTLSEAYQKLHQDKTKVMGFLKAAQLPASAVRFDSVQTRPLYQQTAQGYNTNDISGYELQQQVWVETNEVTKVAQLSEAISELIGQGIDFRANAPQFFYTQLDKLKIEMLGQATKNAYQRANSMATNTGRRVGRLRSANMGVFQITAKNSTEVSDYGINDTTGQEKKVTAVVNASFTLE